MSRRRLLGFGAGAAAVAAAGAGIGVATDRLVTNQESGDGDPAGAVDFYGKYQSGIITPAQDRLHFAAFDLTTTDRNAVVDLLKKWTEAAAAMCAGREVGETGAVGGIPQAPPEDTGEALELPASALTVTIGFGASLFDSRFGLAGLRPPAMADLPHFPGDNLDPARSGGDLCVQACANDPQVAVHAVRNLARIAFGTAAVRYSQLGFGRTSSTSKAQSTPRNLFGFKDGTRNIKAEETAELDRQVWVQPGDGPDWMVDGTYMVSRRIRMRIEPWDRTSLFEQEGIVGRKKGSGAPLGREGEFDKIDFDVKGPDDQPLITDIAHIRLAHPDNHNGARLLRRGYNFVDGSDGLGTLDAGLFFLSFQRDPHRQFVPVQRALALKDEMNEYIQHVGSGLWACPAGVRSGGWWGEALFG